MCLAARVPGIVGIGIEIDPAMAELARANIAANQFVGLTIMTGDITEIALPMADHVMANPPWHDRRSTASPVGRRRLAKQESGQGIEAWIAAMAPALRDGGSLTMIVPPALVGRWRAACAAAGLAGLIQHALVPKVGREAKLMVVQAVRGIRVPGGDDATVLHQANGAFTDEIDAVLRHGAALVPYGGEKSRLPGA
jgi:tRNA1(Val) A37 N6-methylase TrmN6